MVAVALGRRRQQELAGVVQGLGDDGHAARMNLAGEPAVHHLVEVPQQAEAGHVGAGVDVVAAAARGGVLVQRGHGLHSGLHGLLGRLAHPARRADNAHAQPLGQDQPVPRLAAVVVVDAVRVDDPCDRQAVLHIGIRNGMPAGQGPSGLNHLLRAAAHDLPQDVQIHLFRETDDIQRRLYLPAHGVHITQGIGGGDAAKGIGVVHHRREEIQGLHNGSFIRHPVDGGVIPAVKAHQQVLVNRPPGQAVQNMLQDAGPQLRRAAASPTKNNLFLHNSSRSPGLLQIAACAVYREILNRPWGVLPRFL